MQLNATLYVHPSPEAADLYCRAFGLTLGYTALHPDGTYLHASLCREGREVLSVSESDNPGLRSLLRRSDIRFNRPITNLGLGFPTEEELRHAFSVLSGEGTVTLPLQSLPWCSLAAEVVDKFGVYWYIHLNN